jgi:hypothetical protein
LPLYRFERNSRGIYLRENIANRGLIKNPKKASIYYKNNVYKGDLK